MTHLKNLCFSSLGSVSLKVLVRKGGILPSEDTARALLNYELWLPLGHSGIPVSRGQQARRGVIILAGVTDPNHEVEAGLLLQICLVSRLSIWVPVGTHVLSFDGNWKSAITLAW